MLSAAVSYRLFAADPARVTARVAAEPATAREAAHYLARIEQIGSIDAFLKDDRVFTFAMRAFGLGDMAYAKGFMRKALTEGIDASRSFANTLADRRYREFVETFNFARYGETTTVFDRARQGTVDRYVRLAVERSAGDRNEGARLALYFARRAPEIASPYHILADAALTKFAQTALGLPAAASNANIDRQAELIAGRLDIAQLRDPTRVDALVARFLARWDAQAGSEGVAAVTTLFARQTTPSSALAFSLQALRRGGG